MKIIIVAGGPVENQPDFSMIKKPDGVWVGVDRGVYHLLQKGIVPDLAFGDFDSMKAEEKEWISSFPIRTMEFDSEKDKTDLELALDWAIEESPEKIMLIGATGGRLDHELANIQLMLLGLEAEVEIEIWDRQNKIQLKKPGNYQVHRDDYHYVSFLPMNGPVSGLTLTGFKYPLHQQFLAMGSTLCISNELVNKIGTYSFSNGILMLIKSHD